ncbi:hypothetical protein MRB53_038778 [Persea americana]|nr:hypothetical protein MRB53_038778 [Persea americana]
MKGAYFIVCPGSILTQSTDSVDYEPVLVNPDWCNGWSYRVVGRCTVRAVKIRLQDKAQAAKYNGMIDCVTKIVREEGPLALYNGLEATAWRHILWNAGYFGCIFQVKALLPKSTEKKTQVLNDLLSGAVAAPWARYSTHRWMWSNQGSKTRRESPGGYPSTDGHGRR